MHHLQWSHYKEWCLNTPDCDWLQYLEGKLNTSVSNVQFWFHKMGGWGSGVEPASCYLKVSDSTTQVCMSSVLGQDTEPKLLLMCSSAPCVATTISVCISGWLRVVTVSRFGQKHLLNVNKNNKISPDLSFTDTDLWELTVNIKC